jgi:peptide/nickel transport system permease protein
MSQAMHIEASTLLATRKGKPAWQQMLRVLSRNKLVLAGIAIAALMLFAAIFAGFIAPYDPIAQKVSDSLHSPSSQYWFGTDRFGRDVLSRTIYGSRISMWVGFASVSLAASVGTLLGLLSGYCGGWVDNVISRIMDIFFSFPAILLAIAIAAMLGPGMNNALLAIAIVYSPLFSRVVRGSVLAERNKEYIEAARGIGASNRRVVGMHLLPNVLPPIIVQGSVTLSHAILMESYVSFLGLGIQPPQASWGSMLNEGRAYLEAAPWISIFPGVAVMLAVLAFNLLGDGLRDVLDPRLRSV